MIEASSAHGTAVRRRRRAAPRKVLAPLLWLLALQGAIAAGDFEVLNGTTAGGGGHASAGQYRLVWTLGEPAMGTTSAGGYRLTSGFPATIGYDEAQGGPTDGDIFKDGFEGSPGETP